MTRRPRKTALTAEQKKQSRKIKRELRKANAAEGGLAPALSVPTRTAHEDEQFWSGIRGRLRAEKILNSSHVKPYWLSIPKANGSPPVAVFFPCSLITHRDRWYYGFSFREHRDRCWKGWSAVHGARKELTGSALIPMFR